MPLRIREPAPGFVKPAVFEGKFVTVSLDQYRGKWLVLSFFPKAFTFVCPTEVVAFSDAAPRFRERNAEVVFASTDSQYALLAWNKRALRAGGLGGVKIPLVADQTHSLAREYGVLLENEGIAQRGLFIIDPEGALEQITINDMSVGRSVDEVLRLLDAFQFSREYRNTGPVRCPSDTDVARAATAHEQQAMDVSV